MEKAWVDFKTDEETFRLIVKYEESYVFDMMRKKYGKDFDGINVKGSIKRNEVYKYNLSELLIKMDVLCAEKLKEKGKNLVGFFSNSKDLMAKKLCLIYDLKSSELDDILTSFTSENKDIFIYGFGINRKKQNISTFATIFNINTDDVYKKLMLAIREFDSFMKQKKNLTVNPSQNAVAIPAALITHLEKHNYRKEAIFQELLTYDKSVQSVLRKYYGQNFDKVKSPSIPVSKTDAEIILSVISGPNSVIEKLIKDEVVTVKPKEDKPKDKNEQENAKLPRKKFNIIKFYKEKGYTINEFLEAFKSLSLTEQELIKREFDENFNERYNQDLSEEEKTAIFQLIKSENAKIETLMKQGRKSNMKKSDEKKNIKPTVNERDKRKYVPISEYKTLNEYYKDRGYSEEDLENLYNNLTARGKVHFDNYINVVEKNGKRIFYIKKPILRQADKTARNYFVNAAIAIFKNNGSDVPDKEVVSTNEQPTVFSHEPKQESQTVSESNINVLEEVENQDETVTDTNQFASQENINNETANLSVETSKNGQTLIDIKDAVNAYIKLLKESNILTRELIINSKLPKKYEYFLLTEFDLNSKCEYSLDEEAEFLNMSIEELCKNIVEAVEYLRNKLNSKLSINQETLKLLMKNPI